jgi:hypothetical protein
MIPSASSSAAAAAAPSLGESVGISVGVVVAVLVAAILGFVLWRRRHQARQRSTNAKTLPMYQPGGESDKETVTRRSERFSKPLTVKELSSVQEFPHELAG